MTMTGRRREGEEAGGLSLAEARLLEQRIEDDKVFPLVLTPSSPLESVVDACKLLETRRDFLEQQLNEHGALFLRGFPLHTASDFHDALEALGWQNVPYIGAATRSQVVGSVFTANDANPDACINFHHEMAQTVDTIAWPSKLLFFCETPALEGGQTQIVMSHKVTQGVSKQCPEFMQKLEELGLLYLQVMPKEKDSKHFNFRGWSQVFGTRDEKEAEERAKKAYNAKVEWLPGGIMSLVAGPAKATRYFSHERENAWFNMIALLHSGTSHKVGISIAHPCDVVFGDGSPLPEDVVKTCREIHEENSVDIPWQQGDLMIINNRLVMHGRRAYKPPRQILVALCS